MAGRKRIEDDETIQAQIAAFAYSYCYFLAKNRGRRGTRQAAAEAVRITDKTAERWVTHPIFKEHCKQHVMATLKKFDKTPDDVLTEVAKEAFHPVDMSQETHGDKIRALGILAQHFNLVGDTDKGNANDPGGNVIIMLPQNRFSGKAIDTEYKEVSVDETTDP